MSQDKAEPAEAIYRAAFERLKSGNPINVKGEYTISQNNVAREALRDPSALKKKRFPILVAEIQVYTAKKNTPNNKKKKTSNRTRTTKERLKDCTKQRDKMCSIISSQNEYIDNLLNEINELKSGKVIRK